MVKPSPVRCGYSNEFSSPVMSTMISAPTSDFMPWQREVLSGHITLHNQNTRDKARLSIGLESMNDRPQRFRVPMMRLADLMDECGDQSIRLLKVDVEGYEPEVIRGAGSELRKIEHIALEILPDCMGRVEITSMLNRLTETGFTLCDIYGAAWEQGASLPENNLLATRVGSSAPSLGD